MPDSALMLLSTVAVAVASRAGLGTTTREIDVTSPTQTHSDNAGFSHRVPGARTGINHLERSC